MNLKNRFTIAKSKKNRDLWENGTQDDRDNFFQFKRQSKLLRKYTSNIIYVTK